MLEQIREKFVEVSGTHLPTLVGAVVILVVGWIAALMIRGLIRAALRRIKMDQKFAKLAFGEEAAAKIELEKWISSGFYYLILLLVLVGFLETLGLQFINEPLNRMLGQIFEFAPRILSAGAILLFAWVLARVLRFTTERLLTATKIDERLSEPTEQKGEKISISGQVSTGVYWLVLFMFLPAVLDALALRGLLNPVQEMLAKFLGYLPNILAGGVVLLVGWFLAKMVRSITNGLLGTAGIDGLGDRAGLSTVLGKQKLSGLISMIVYILVLIPTIIAAFEALKFEAISKPASKMLQVILSAVPSIFAAGVILLVAYLVGLFVANTIGELLNRLGFNTVLAKLGCCGDEVEEGKKQPSAVVGYLVMVGILLFATMEAADVIGFTGLSSLVNQFTVFLGHIVLGLFIFGIGLYIANWIAGIIKERGGSQATLLALASKIAMIVFSGAMALRQMGLANDIINMAFGLLVGAIAVAVAIAFGFGCRDLACRTAEKWLNDFSGEGSSQKE